MVGKVNDSANLWEDELRNKYKLLKSTPFVLTPPEELFPPDFREFAKQKAIGEFRKVIQRTFNKFMKSEIGLYDYFKTTYSSIDKILSKYQFDNLRKSREVKDALLLVWAVNDPVCEAEFLYRVRNKEIGYTLSPPTGRSVRDYDKEINNYFSRIKLELLGRSLIQA